VREKSDERILGSGEFVEQLIEQSDQLRKGGLWGRPCLVGLAVICIGYLHFKGLSHAKKSQVGCTRDAASYHCPGY